MSIRRKVLDYQWRPTVWTLELECGHVAFRSNRYLRKELPPQVLCEACNSLIQSQVKNPAGALGRITNYSGGRFEIAWNDSVPTRWTLEELRNRVEIL